MQFFVKGNNAYKKSLTNIAFMTALSALGCVLFGYLFLPMASAFYAALLFYENRGKKILSILIPIVTLLINLLFDVFSSSGSYSPEGIAYIFVGLLIYLLCRNGVSKNETVFWGALLIFVFMVLSVLSIALSLKQAEGFTSFWNLYESFKAEFSDMLTSLVISDENGRHIAAYNPIEAEIMLRELIIMILPLSILLSVILTALTLRIFSGIVLKHSGEHSGINEWIFKPSNPVAYFYVAVAVLSIFAGSGGSPFSYVLLSLDIIFAPIFAYMGASIIHALIVSHGKSPLFAALVIVFACVILYTFSFKLLSFIGVYFTVIANKISKKE